MEYQNVLPGIFRARPNRFIALVDVDGREEVCHVKNTGRCRELLVPGAVVYLEKSANPLRKTQYDLIAVEKETAAGTLLINMDSQAPNKAAEEALPRLLPGLTLLRPETKFGNSRFDFYAETEGNVYSEEAKRVFSPAIGGGKYTKNLSGSHSQTSREKWFVEVKGVTLEENGVARFPDAPTERGAKHLKKLCACMDSGYRAAVLFLIQFQPVRHFEPNAATDPAFAAALSQAAARGVEIWALDCAVTPTTMTADKPVEISLLP